MKDNTICRRCGIKLNNWRDILHNLWSRFPSILCFKCRKRQREFEKEKW